MLDEKQVISRLKKRICALRDLVDKHTKDNNNNINIKELQRILNVENDDLNKLNIIPRDIRENYDMIGKKILLCDFLIDTTIFNGKKTFHIDKLKKILDAPDKELEIGYDDFCSKLIDNLQDTTPLEMLAETGETTLKVVDETTSIKNEDDLLKYIHKNRDKISVLVSIDSKHQSKFLSELPGDLERENIDKLVRDYTDFGMVPFKVLEDDGNIGTDEK